MAWQEKVRLARLNPEFIAIFAKQTKTLLFHYAFFAGTIVEMRGREVDIKTFDIMTAFYIWLSIAIILFILEVLITSSFAMLCLAVGAVAAALTGLAGLNEIWQLIVFAVFALLAFIFVRPFLIKKLNKRSMKRPKTNADALIGKTAKVVERIGGDNQLGRIIIDGDYWQALSIDDLPVETGELVVVKSIDSIVLNVQAVNPRKTSSDI